MLRTINGSNSVGKVPKAPIKESGIQDTQVRARNKSIGEPEIDAAVYNPETSRFIRTVLLLALEIEPVEAVKQVETVAEILTRRAKRIGQIQRR